MTTRRRPGARTALLGAVTAMVMLGGCGGSAAPGEAERIDESRPSEDASRPEPAGDLSVASGAFSDSEMIPKRHTCDGDGVSPPLTWEQVPDEAAELVVIVTDPDAPEGEFVHWVVAGLDPAHGGLEESDVPEEAVQGTNGFDEIGYGPPCPPSEDTAHRYVFTVYASAEPLDVSPGVSAEELRDRLEGSALADGELVGRYNR